MRPEGWRGRLFGVLMERLNRPTYRAAVELLSPLAGRRVLEIGFGTGALVERLLRTDATVRVCGVDPTPTMRAVARARGAVVASAERVDLREGADAPLPWLDGAFDAVAALHSFQFWPDPVRSVREIARVLVPGGRLVLLLRDHGARAPEWLPNPLSRGADEVGAAIRLLAKEGFDVERRPRVGASHVLRATSSRREES